MLKGYLARIEADENLFITDVQRDFENIQPQKHILCNLDLVAGGEYQVCIKLPLAGNETESAFIKRYVNARVYNIISTYGGTKMTFCYDLADVYLNDIVDNIFNEFCINKGLSERTGYGKCINVAERMNRYICGGTFTFSRASSIPDRTEKKASVKRQDILLRLSNAIASVRDKIILGIDVGGSDIKLCATRHGNIIFLKEYDWHPAEFATVNKIIDPILVLARFMRNSIALFDNRIEVPDEFADRYIKAMDTHVSIHELAECADCLEVILKEKCDILDGIGICFPDVVIGSKIVGGETHKTHGIRNNQDVDYEKEFSKLSDLDTLLKRLCTPNGRVSIINDGPMAAFAAAVEMSCTSNSQKLQKGIIAHTLGTEFGSGWIDESGNMPKIPLEIFNYVIDLGCGVQSTYDKYDVRSTQNIDTGIVGTLQKYTNQSGVFRLAVKYYSKSEPQKIEEIFNRQYLAETSDGIIRLNTSKSKEFLEYVMELASQKDHIACNIMREIGAYVAAAYEQMQSVLDCGVNERVLFGRLVKHKKCFQLMCEGAKEQTNEIVLLAADENLATTELMRQLAENDRYTVAQFAQAVGAVYYAFYEQ